MFRFRLVECPDSPPQGCNVNRFGAFVSMARRPWYHKRRGSDSIVSTSTGDIHVSERVENRVESRGFTSAVDRVDRHAVIRLSLVSALVFRDAACLVWVKWSRELGAQGAFVTQGTDGGVCSEAREYDGDFEEQSD